MDAQQLKLKLHQHYGGETVYRHALNAKFNYTAGMKAMFTHAGGGAYWLSDILATEPDIQKGVHENSFCVGAIKVIGTVGHLTVAVDCSEHADSGIQFSGAVFTRTIDFTDFPEGTWKFYLTHTPLSETKK